MRSRLKWVPLFVGLLFFVLLCFDGCAERGKETTTAVKREITGKEAVTERVVMRLLLAAGLSPVDCRYANALSVMYEDEVPRGSGISDWDEKGVSKKERYLILVRGKERERLLADEFFKAGYYTEAAFHYRNLLEYFLTEDSYEREDVEERLSFCLRYLPEGFLRLDKGKYESVKNLGLFVRVGGKNLILVAPDRIGVARTALPYYFAAQMLQKYGALRKAIEIYEDILSLFVQKGSIAEWDIYAKLAFLYGFCNIDKGAEYYDRVLDNFHRLPLEVVCAELSLPTYEDEPGVLRRPVLCDDVIPVPGVVHRGIERLRSVDEQKPFPVVRGWTYLKAIEMRRREFLAMYRMHRQPLCMGDFGALVRLANLYILNGNFDEALKILKKVRHYTEEEEETEFKILACNIRLLLDSESKEKERLVKALQQVDDYIKRHPDAEYRREARFLKARVLLMLDRRREAHTIFAELASDKDFEFSPDAELALSLIERRLLKVTVPKSLTTSDKLPIRLTLKNIDEVKFRFMRLEEAFPVVEGSYKSVEKRVWEFLNMCKGKDTEVVYETTAKFELEKFGESETVDYELPIPEEGVFVVEAEGGGVSCRFIAIRSSVRVTVVSLPESSILILRDGCGRPVEGVSLFAGRRFLGRTDSDGLLFTRSIPAPFCEKCGGPCDFCNYCREYWKKKTKGMSEGPPLVITGVGKKHIFVAEALYNPLKKARGSKRGVLLYLYTDRPVYRAGDVVRFCGILRLEKEWLGKRPESRFEVLANEVVRVEVKDKISSSTLFSREFTTNRLGKFSGEYYIPETASRRMYTLAVTYGSKTEEAEFEVRDFVKPDYVVKMIPTKGGFRVFAGYSWGEPVAGAKITFCKEKEEGEKELDEKGEAFIPAEDGEVVAVALMKDGKELAQKEATFRTPVELTEKEREESVEEKTEEKEKREEKKRRKVSVKKESVAEKRPDFAVVPDKEVYYRGDTIRLKLVCRPFKSWEAVVVLGDECGYDCKFVASDTETATVEFPVCGAYDPATFVWTRFKSGDNERIERRRLRVCTRLLNVKIIPEKRECEPGEETRVTLKVMDTSGKPVVADTSLAVVDEAIFTITEDRTPDIYEFFYKEREGACSFFDFGEPFFSGEEVLVESKPNLDNWRYFNVSLMAFLFSNLVSDTERVPKGTSFDNLSNKNLGASGAVDAYGLGGGVAGAYGARWGEGALVRKGGAACTESVIAAFHMWLYRHQKEDGSWDSDGFNKRCHRGVCDGAGMSEYDVMVTSLSTLSFLGHGNTHRIGRFRKCVKKALRWLIIQQEDDGSIGRNSGRFWMLNHTTATMALCEAYAMTQDIWLREACEKAVGFLLHAKNAGSGWGFEPKDSSPNSLITGWATLALKSAKSGGISIPQTVFSDIVAFFDSVTDLRGRTYFSRRGEAAPDLLCNADDYDSLPEWTAISALCRIFCGQSRNHPKVKRAINILLRHLPLWDNQKRKVNFHYWYFGTYLFFQYGGTPWKRWNRAVKDVLLKNQRRMGCPDGSWDPVGKWGKFYGRVGTTALGTLTLEIYYRYARGLVRPGLRRPDYPEPKIRLYFPDTAFWAPHLLTNENGEIKASFKLPDTITSVRLTARAVGENTSVGEAVEWIEIKKDFFVKLKTPKFFVCGDETTIYADVYNYTDTPQKVNLKLNGSGFRLLSDGEVECSVPNDGVPRRAYWTLLITSESFVRLTVSAVAGEFSDAVQLDIPVRLLGVEVVESIDSPLKRHESLLISIPESAGEETPSVELVVRPTKSSLYYILEALRYLVGYPYG